MTVRYRKWTKEEEMFVIKNYPYMRNKDMAKALNRKEMQVGSKVQHLKKRGLITTVKKVKSSPLREPKPGLDLQSLKLQIGKVYKVHIPRDKNSKLGTTFTGTLVQETDRHITLKHSSGYCESFLKADLLLGEGFKEVG